jgi:hypothetical protein
LIMIHRTSCALRVLALIVLIATVLLPAVVRAEEPGPVHIKVLIDNLHYEGKNAYSIVISAENPSSRNVLVNIIKEGFFIQTDHGWLELTALKGTISGSEEFLLLPNGKIERVASISIPLTVPDLFRTYEGDLSLMYRYTYSVRTGDGTGAVFRMTDEVYCWVKPGTSQWILREGM